MHGDFPSIWIELLELGKKKKQIIGGFYRVWNHKNDKTEKGLIERINIFTDQIDRAAAEKNTRILITGDADLDSNKWDSVHFSGHNVAILLKAALNRNGHSYKNIGNTYHANHAQVNGKVAESALDHVYSFKYGRHNHKNHSK